MAKYNPNETLAHELERKANQKPEPQIFLSKRHFRKKVKQDSKQFEIKVDVLRRKFKGDFQIGKRGKTS